MHSDISSYCHTTSFAYWLTVTYSNKFGLDDRTVTSAPLNSFKNGLERLRNSRQMGLLWSSVAKDPEAEPAPLLVKPRRWVIGECLGLLKIQFKIANIVSSQTCCWQWTCLDRFWSRSDWLFCDHSWSKTRLITIMNLTTKLGYTAMHNWAGPSEYQLSLPLKPACYCIQALHRERGR